MKESLLLILKSICISSLILIQACSGSSGGGGSAINGTTGAIELVLVIGDTSHEVSIVFDENHNAEVSYEYPYGSVAPTTSRIKQITFSGDFIAEINQPDESSIRIVDGSLLEITDNTIAITLKLEDGTSRQYSINFNFSESAPSSDTTIEELTLDVGGVTKTVIFDENREGRIIREYTSEQSAPQEVTIELLRLATGARALSGDQTLDAAQTIDISAGFIVITVVAQDADSTSDYRIDFSFPQIMTDALKEITLLDVSMDGKAYNDIAFDHQNTATIRHEYANGSTKPTEVTVERLEFWGTSASVLEKEKLPIADNDQSVITITALNDSTVDYLINFEFTEAVADASASIDQLVLNIGGREEVIQFDGLGRATVIYEYSDKSTDVVSVDIKDILLIGNDATHDMQASYEIIISNPEPLIIIVTAADGLTKSAYYVGFVFRHVNDASSISNLVISLGSSSDLTRDVIFGSNTEVTVSHEFAYGVSLPVDIGVVDISVSPDATASVVKDQTIDIYADSVAITVTAQDGSEQVYTINFDFSNALNTEKAISSLVISLGSSSDLTRDVIFGSNTEIIVSHEFAYGVSLPVDIGVVDISVSPDATASVVKDQTIDIYAGSVAITVTAQDGSEQVYTINFDFSNALNTEKAISSLVISLGSSSDLTRDVIFGSNTEIIVSHEFAYGVSLPVDIGVVDISVSPDATASVVKDQTIDIYAGSVAITVTAQDGSEQIYTINFDFSNALNTEKAISSLVISLGSSSDLTRDVIFGSNTEATVSHEFPYGDSFPVDIGVVDISLSSDATASVVKDQTVDISAGSASITVTAQDGSEQVYTINFDFSNTPNTEKAISSLVISLGSSSDLTRDVIFGSNTEVTVSHEFAYGVSIPVDIGVVDISLSSDATASVVKDQTIDISAGSASITVTAQDGGEQVYTINFDFSNTPNTEKAISSLVISLGSSSDLTRDVIFGSSTEVTVSHDFAYGVSIPVDIGVVDISLSSDATASVVKDQTIDISAGSASITVTAQDGSEQIYTINFNFSNTSNTEKAISSLVISLGSSSDLTRDVIFGSSTEITVSHEFAYGASLPVDIGVVDIAVSSGATASLVKDQTIDISAGSASITVTAQDGSEQVYTINFDFSNALNPAKAISSLVISLGSSSDLTRDVVFGSNTEVTVSHEFPYGESFPVDIGVVDIALSIDATASVVKDQTIDISAGSASITVTAQDGGEQVYTINFDFSNTPNTEKAISSLVISLGSSSDLTRDVIFGSNTEITVSHEFAYGVSLPVDIAVVDIALSSDATASVVKDQTIDISAGSASITVTAQDGNEQVYTINFNFSNTPNTEKAISSLVISLGSSSDLTQDVIFDSNTEVTVSHEFPYGVSLPVDIGVLSIAVSPDATASVVKDQTVDISADSVAITVTAQDGSEQVYTINFDFSNTPNTEKAISSLVISLGSSSDLTQDVIFGSNTEVTVSHEFPYGVSLPVDIGVLSISVSPDATASVVKDQTIDISAGSASITVTAQDGNEQVYTINFDFSNTLNTANNLISLSIDLADSVSHITFDEANQARVSKEFAYGVAFPTEFTMVDIAVSPDARASVAKGQAIDISADSATITVTSHDALAEADYTITFDFTIAKSLKDVVATSSIPSDLSSYDELTRAVLTPYASGATINVLYVTIDGGTSSQDATSWDRAASASELKSVLDGVVDASSDNIYLILVASGVTSSGVTSDVSYDVGEAMSMKRYVAIVGGWDASGDWGRSGSTILSGGGTHRVFNNNYSTVGSDSTALLYDVIIKSGYVAETDVGTVRNTDDNGGGMANYNFSPTLINVKFEDNVAYDYGGGLYNKNSSPALSNVIFENNDASGDSDGSYTADGGGMYNDNSSPILSSVTFTGNTASGSGGGMYNSGSSPILRDITFRSNEAHDGAGVYNSQSSLVMTYATFVGNVSRTGGGGVLNLRSSPTFNNVTFYDNKGSAGGGMYNFSSDPVLVNVTFSGNNAANGGAINNVNSSPRITHATFVANEATFSGGGMYNDNNGSSGPVIVNSIFWDNIAGDKGAQIALDNSGQDIESLTIAYSVIGGGAGVDSLATSSDNANLVNIVSPGIESVDPDLGSLVTNSDYPVATVSIGLGGSAIDKGVHVRIDATNDVWYYSTDSSSDALGTWYTGFSDSGLSSVASITAGSTDLISITDATDMARTARPDAGAYEARKSSTADLVSLTLNVNGADRLVSFGETRIATVDYPYETDAPVSVIVKSIVLSAQAEAAAMSGGSMSNVVANTSIDVAVGSTSITVTSQDGSASHTYSILFTGALAPSDLRDIKSLVINVGGEDQTISFGSGTDATTDYPYGSDLPDSVVIKSISTSYGSTASVQADDTVSLIDGRISIVVIAQDGISEQSYSIAFIEALSFSLQDVLDTESVMTATVPSDMTYYDELALSVFASYEPGAKLTARYVTMTGGLTAQDGTSWESAAPANQIKPILDGISDASADNVYFILIASGVLSHDAYVAGSSMKMKNHVAIIGGWDASGDWGRSGSTNFSGDRSYRVFHNTYSEQSPLDGTALLYGVTIAGGGGQLSDRGSGMYNYYASPKLNNVAFIGNVSVGCGGGLHNEYSSPTLTDVTFSSNASSGSDGGGMCNENSSPIMVNVTFSRNNALKNGGGMYVRGNSSPVLINNTFAYNVAAIESVSGSGSVGGSGGAIYSDTSEAFAPVIVNSLIWGNRIDDQLYADGLGDGLQIALGLQGGDESKKIAIAYSVIHGGTDESSFSARGVDTSGAIIATDNSTNSPRIDLLADNGGSVSTFATSTRSSAINKGIYVRRNIDDSGQSLWYYSEDGDSWYTDFTSDGGLTTQVSAIVAEAAGTLDITARDATGKVRKARPDAGAYESIYEAYIADLIVTVSGVDHTIVFDDGREATVDYPYSATALSSITVKSIGIFADGTSDYDNGDTISLTDGKAIITITDQDGTSTQTYTINLVMSANTAADITSLVVNVSGTDHTIDFDSNRQATINYPYQATALTSITVKSIGVSDQATVSTAKDATIDVSNDQATITVTAQDGTEQTYTINLVMSANSEADITSLVVNVSGVDHTIDFGDNTEATVDYLYSATALSSVTVKSIGISTDATSDYATGATINVANDQATITVTAQDGTTTQTYTINLVMLANTAADITSLILTVSGEDYTVSFDANREATVDYLYGSTAPASVTIKSISLSADATANVSNDQTVDLVGGGIEITVTAQDGSTTQSYTIAFVMQMQSIQTLRDILDTTVGTSTVPADLSGYDELTQAVLAPYNAGANLVARYVTISGGETTQGGLSWSDAVPANQLKSTLDGISDASSDKVYLLLVASGSTADASYDAGEAMKMKNHVAIIGGWDASGDWGRSGSTVLSGGGSHRVFNNGYSESSRILGSTSLLYGLTIAAGSATDSNGNGGGMYNEYVSLTLTNVVFSGNSAIGNGGGMYNRYSSLSMTNITMSDNSAAYGAGMYNSNSHLRLTNITLSGNSATGGGGMANDHTFMTMVNATFSGNSATSNGGGMSMSSTGTATIVNSIFWDNSSDTGADEIYAYRSSRSPRYSIIAYSVIEGGAAPVTADVTTDLATTDPLLSDLTTDTGSSLATMAIGTSGSAKDAGVYVRQRDYINHSGDISAWYYYSLDTIEWYTSFNDSGLTDITADAEAKHADSIDITATDATGRARSNRPDAGAYEARQ